MARVEVSTSSDLEPATAWTVASDLDRFDELPQRHRLDGCRIRPAEVHRAAGAWAGRSAARGGDDRRGGSPGIGISPDRRYDGGPLGGPIGRLVARILRSEVHTSVRNLAQLR